MALDCSPEFLALEALLLSRMESFDGNIRNMEAFYRFDR